MTATANDGQIQERHLNILIVGAGIAGLAAARTLEMRGFRPVVVEWAAESPTEGKSIFLLGNATRALGNLGLLRQVQNLSTGGVLDHLVTHDFGTLAGRA
jgi:2-polyprenyl-6-methoxyphenol hydroxylase-like FAD-dependent oxidoreductase